MKYLKYTRGLIAIAKPKIVHSGNWWTIAMPWWKPDPTILKNIQKLKVVWDKEVGKLIFSEEAEVSLFSNKEQGWETKVIGNIHENPELLKEKDNEPET